VLGAAQRDDAREVPAAAVADERDAAPLALGDALDAPRQAPDGLLAAAHVAPEPRAVRAVVRAVQPAPHHRERPIAREEPGHEQDGQPAAVDARAGEDLAAAEAPVLPGRDRLGGQVTRGLN
jgi:hypothetical protein